MHDIWNLWHGCVKCSEGCRNCYMYYNDARRGKNGADIYRTKTGFRYPLSKDRSGQYKVKSGEMLRVCMNSDFFLEEADPWRDEAWEIIHQRPDVKFWLLTKRPERVAEHLPWNWGEGWENVMFNVTCENQRRADERIPILLELPFKHKGIMCAPFIGPVSIPKYLPTGQIEQVLCDGESYDGARPCHYEWVKALHDECRESNITFVFCTLGSCFVKDGKTYHIRSGKLRSEQAARSGLSFQGKPIEFKLTDTWGDPISAEALYQPYFGAQCNRCGMKLTCNGCSRCGKCGYVANLCFALQIRPPFMWEIMGKVLLEERAAIHRWDHVCQKPLFRNQRIPLGWYFHRNRKRRMSASILILRFFL